MHPHLAFALLVVLGFVLTPVHRAAGAIFLGHVVRRWPIAPGVITSSGEAVLLTERTAHVVVEYSYVIRGVEYRGNRVYRRGRLGTGLRRFLESHTVGVPVQVYYHPAAPAESALLAGADGASWVQVGIFALAILGLYLLGQ